MALIQLVMINGTIKKYENKKKTLDLHGNSCRKKPRTEKKVSL